MNRQQLRDRGREKTHLPLAGAEPSKLLLHVTLAELGEPFEKGEARDSADVELVSEEMAECRHVGDRKM